MPTNLARGCPKLVVLDLLGAVLEHDHAFQSALAPSAIVEQASDLGALWRLPSGEDVALDDEIATFLNKESA